MRVIVSIAAWICLGCLAKGDEPPIPLSLEQARIGAFWEEGEHYGHVRVLSFAYGFEHVHHKLVIEWIAAPDSPDSEPKIVARKELEEIETIWAIGEVEFVQADGGWNLLFTGQHTYHPEETAKFSIKLNAVGKYEFTQEKGSGE